MVDTGSSYTFMPRDLLRQLGVSPIDTRSFVLADESRVQNDVGEARVRLNGRELTTLVVFGPDDALPLLGATTLQLFSLGVDPVNERLVPVDAFLKRSYIIVSTEGPH